MITLNGRRDLPALYRWQTPFFLDALNDYYPKQNIAIQLFLLILLLRCLIPYLLMAWCFYPPFYPKYCLWILKQYVITRCSLTRLEDLLNMPERGTTN